MYHEADVWFVDAHSKCNRGCDQANVVPQESFLISRTLGTGQARVIRLRAYAIFTEIPSQ